MAFLKKSLLLVLFLGFVSLYICEEDLTKHIPMDIEAAPARVVAANCLKDKDSFQLFRWCGKSSGQLKKCFGILDRDLSGYIEEEELRFFKNYQPNPRALNDKCLMKAGDSDGDGRIGVKELKALIKA